MAWRNSVLIALLGLVCRTLRSESGEVAKVFHILTSVHPKTA